MAKGSFLLYRRALTQAAEVLGQNDENDENVEMVEGDNECVGWIMVGMIGPARGGTGGAGMGRENPKIRKSAECSSPTFTFDQTKI